MFKMHRLFYAIFLLPILAIYAATTDNNDNEGSMVDHLVVADAEAARAAGIGYHEYYLYSDYFTSVFPNHWPEIEGSSECSNMVGEIIETHYYYLKLTPPDIPVGIGLTIYILVFKTRTKPSQIS